MARTKFLAAVIGIILVAAACGSSDNGSDKTAKTGLLVYTTPLSEATVSELAASFKAEQPGEPITVISEDSDALVDAINDGDADVAVSLGTWLESTDDETQINSLGRTLAVIAVPAANPAGVTDLEPFAADSGLRTTVCSENTAVGNFSVQVLTNAEVTPDPATVSEGCEAESLGQLAAGELDASLMFRNDLEVPDGVTLLDIDEDTNVIFDISYVVFSDSSRAKAFGEFLSSETAETILTENGYLP